MPRWPQREDPDAVPIWLVIPEDGPRLKYCHTCQEWGHNINSCPERAARSRRGSGQKMDVSVKKARLDAESAARKRLRLNQEKITKPEFKIPRKRYLPDRKFGDGSTYRYLGPHPVTGRIFVQHHNAKGKRIRVIAVGKAQLDRWRSLIDLMFDGMYDPFHGDGSYQR